MDQLRSSLRQVADALAQTVAAVRNTREQLREVSEEREDPSEMEVAEERRHGVVGRHERQDGEGDRETTDQAAALILRNPLQMSQLSSSALTSSSETSDTSITQSTPLTISSYPHPPSSALLPPLSTFDGSQESAVATLASTDPNDPLHTFFSAIASAPPPLLSLNSTHSVTPSQGTTVASTTSTATSSFSRLPVFTQLNQLSGNSATTNPAARSGSAPRMETAPPAPIPTAVIQDPRGVSLHSESDNSMTLAESFASSSVMVSGSPHAHYISLRSSQNQEMADARTSNLAEELARVVSQLVPATSSPIVSTTVTPLITSSSTPLLQASPPSTSSAVPVCGSAVGTSAIHSPSPSDTLGPLLTAALQMPVTSMCTCTSCNSNGAMDVTEAAGGQPVSGRNTCTATTTTSTTEDHRVAHLQASAAVVPEDAVELSESLSDGRPLLSGIPRSALEIVYHNHYRLQQQQQHEHQHLVQQLGVQQPLEGQSASSMAATLMSSSSSPPHAAIATTAPSGDSVNRTETVDVMPSMLTPALASSLVDSDSSVYPSSSSSTFNSLPPPPLIPTTSSSATLSLALASTSQAGGVSTMTPIDPTFLAALPDSIRQEVLVQHEREQRLHRAQQQTSFSSTISPEFLAALPSNIQEEVWNIECFFAHMLTETTKW